MTWLLCEPHKIMMKCPFKYCWCINYLLMWKTGSETALLKHSWQLMFKIRLVLNIILGPQLHLKPHNKNKNNSPSLTWRVSYTFSELQEFTVCLVVLWMTPCDPVVAALGLSMRNESVVREGLVIPDPSGRGRRSCGNVPRLPLVSWVVVWTGREEELQWRSRYNTVRISWFHHGKPRCRGVEWEGECKTTTEALVLHSCFYRSRSMHWRKEGKRKKNASSSSSQMPKLPLACKLVEVPTQNLS